MRVQLLLVEININPVEGLKHGDCRCFVRRHHVEININPVEGLKQYLNRCVIVCALRVEININPVEGLKP